MSRKQEQSVKMTLCIAEASGVFGTVSAWVRSPTPEVAYSCDRSSPRADGEVQWFWIKPLAPRHCSARDRTSRSLSLRYK
jgi:hypothetical protein